MKYQNHIVAGVLLLLGGTLAWVRHTQQMAEDGTVVALEATPGQNSDAAVNAPESPQISVTPQASTVPPARALAVAEATPERLQSPSPQRTDALASQTGAASDTLPPLSADGQAFSGSGKFQWYRQGNITWRLDTENGASCIAFATMAEWRRPSVYAHGCGQG